MDIIEEAYQTDGLEQLIQSNYRNDSGLEIFTNSLFSVHAARWLKYFPRQVRYFSEKNFETNFRDQLLFIDGATLFRNPAEEMNKVQDFLNIGRELKTKNFVKE